MKEWYQLTKEEVFKQLETDATGLSAERAAKILSEKGENVLQETRKKSTLQVFAEQFADLLVVILIVAALISMVSGNA